MFSLMMRFYFHIRDGDLLIEDHEGTELADLQAALKDAHASARDILAERLRTGRQLGELSFEIVDDTGCVKATVPMRNVMRFS